ncbi:MAG: hypothetical protein A3G80_09565 [Betaproteobacteria bacterium RIFCSPLOWO2_12_FULL_62_13b]|nr:MAG: hypothetical protein A3G80_09565 [Betaproteobacteria bacterium RIFCSPLOWO2_12_FULL_62_13b]
MTHSVALVNACKPHHWRDRFPPSNAPSAEVARRAQEKFGWLLSGAPPQGSLLPDGVDARPAVSREPDQAPLGGC